MGEALRLAVFDCDGTLVDSQHTIVATMVTAVAAVGLSTPTPSEIRHIIGLTLNVAVERLTVGASSQVQAAIVEAYKARFRALHALPGKRAPLFPGANAALDALDAVRYLLGIATGKGRPGLDAVLAETGMTQRFVTLQTADRAAGKPAPDMRLRAMAETGVDPMETVMIGDTTYDMEMAGNAGVAAIGVGWGYHPAADLLHAGAKTVIDHFADLPDALSS